MQGQQTPDQAAAISMLKRLDAAGLVGEMPLPEALAFANSLTHGYGQDLLNNLMQRGLITPVGRGAIRLVKLTDVGRKALASRAIPEAVPLTSRTGQDACPPPVVPVALPVIDRSSRASSARSQRASERADRPAARMRERAGFIASIAGGVITFAGLLEAIGVPEAQSAVGQGHQSLDLWGNTWFVAGLAVGAFGLTLLLAAVALYVSRRRAAGHGEAAGTS